MNAFSEPLRRIRAHALRFGRSLVVGGGGTALDFAALALSLHFLGLGATAARVVGLLAGGVVLFYGSRSFAFRATAEGAAPQARRFVIAEVVGFPLNIIAFKLLLAWLPGVRPELLSLLANFLLFVTYYYPVRSQLVFKTRSDSAPPAAAIPPAVLVPGAVAVPAPVAATVSVRA
ncbi:MAG TPA: GtrA family protein [Polyangiaceae bacterium]|nr:GtrA family protein [Polyangiaceae bacterium]